MILTQHQEESLFLVLDTINSGINRVVLTGSAGTGKTTLVNYLIDSFPRKKGVIYVTAPTHKALAVLKNKINVRSFVVFETIHAALKLKRKFKPDGEIVFEQEYSSRFPPFENCSLLIVDESSMLNEELLNYLDEYEFPIIFVGKL